MPLETTPVPAPISPSVHPVLPPTARTASIPDQPDADLDRLGDRIAELSARIQAATYALLVLIRQFDEQGGWRPGGFSSCAHWLSWRTGLAPGAAREKVRVAHALARLPLIGAAMQRGRVSYSKVRALTRVATPENEAALLDLALAGTAVHVEHSRGNVFGRPTHSSRPRYGNPPAGKRRRGRRRRPAGCGWRLG